MKINIHRECDIEPTQRTELLGSMFEIPTKQKLSVTLTGDSDHDRGDRDYNIGLIVGPSGSGKTILLNSIFGTPTNLEFSAGSVIDDFPSLLSIEDISRVCQSVGFNTIPSWLRPYSVLSNGERFRVETAIRLLNNRSPITMDEFTSVVDRQVAQFACHAIQKYVRSYNKKLVVASCHYDIIPWLQPDWILEPGNPCRFTWRSLQGRPSIAVAVQRVKYETWRLFSDFHYMSQDLNKAARCYGLFVQNATSSSGVESGFPNYGMDSHKQWSENIRGTDPGLRILPGLAKNRRGSKNVVFSGDKQRSQGESGQSEIHAAPCDEGFGTDSVGSGDSADRARFGRGYPTNESSGELSTKETGPVSRPTETIFEQNGTVGILSTTATNEEFLRESISNQQISLVSSSQRTEAYRIASFCGILYRPHPRVSDIYGFSRMVTLPDFQGLGLAFVLACKLGSAYKALGKRLHSYPNHPAWIRSYQRSSLWLQVKESGSFSPRSGKSSSVGGFGGRRCAVFLFIGDAMNKEEAERLINVSET